MQQADFDQSERGSGGDHSAAGQKRHHEWKRDPRPLRHSHAADLQTRNHDCGHEQDVRLRIHCRVGRR